MNIKKSILLIIPLLLVLPIPAVFAKQGHLTLLAVKETEDGFEGSTADMFLEIRPGTGRVFIETFPLTKFDTQISTRFAKEVACSFLNKDCSRYDFIYTIKAESAIIAGPSAGAAASVLAAALLENLELNESVSITGTINSGGLIGHVGGIKEKIDAGAELGLKKILVPAGEKIIEDKTETSEKVEWNIINDTLSVIIENKTKTTPKETDLETYGLKKDVMIMEVTTLNDAVFEFTGKKFKEYYGNLTIDPEYTQIMKELSVDLCNRTNKLKNDVQDMVFEENYSVVKEDALNLTENGVAAFNKGKFYSSASYCFGANTKFSFLYLLSRNLSKKDIIKMVEIVKKGIDNLDYEIANKKIMTITDLEAYASVKERLSESAYYLNLTLSENKTDEALHRLAYASERVYSALSWYEFFKNMGKRFDLDKENVKKACQNKIAEAEERYQYIMSIFDLSMDGTKKEIDYAYSYLNNKEYELCLFKASMAKAQADTVLNLIGLDKNKTDELLETKLEIVKRNIIKGYKEGIFPVMAYSYYEYSNSLKDSDFYSAILYAEYALELGNFNMYFDSIGKKDYLPFKIDQRVLIFILGIIIGVVFSLPFIKKHRKNNKKATRIKKRRKKR